MVTFEELGVDRIFIDEAHYYKNLAAFSKMRNVGGISQTEAQKSSDLYMKCRYLDELTGGRGVIFATGTPISNTMVEMYTMQKYLQYRTLERGGLLNFDAWASTFGETVTAIEPVPSGASSMAVTVSPKVDAHASKLSKPPLSRVRYCKYFCMVYISTIVLEMGVPVAKITPRPPVSSSR